jgi:hypothetical protein
MSKVTRRRFLHAAAVGTLGSAALSASPSRAQSAKVTKDTLRPVVDANGLAITDAQLEKLAPAVEWSVGQMQKLRDVDVGLGGPAPVFLPAPHAGDGRS